jgi:hypothetical protein
VIALCKAFGRTEVDSVLLNTSHEFARPGGVFVHAVPFTVHLNFSCL